MAIALPGARNVFSTMQLALTQSKRTRLALHKGVHQALDDFRWMHKNISTRPTRIAELIPLQPSVLGFHDASGIGAGGVAFHKPAMPPRGPIRPSQPIVYRYK